MPIITYTGPQPFSLPVEVSPASTLSLPRDVPCEVSEGVATMLVTADHGAFSVDDGPEEAKKTIKNKPGAKP